MKNKILLTFLSLILTSMLAACGNVDKEETTKKETTKEQTIVQDVTNDENESKKITSNENNDIDETVVPKETTESQDPKTETKKNNESDTETVNTIEINSKEDALDYLLTQRPEFANQDTVLLEAFEATVDENNSYYLVKLSSRSIQNQGGTSTVGFFKVYIDGSIESHY